MIDWVGGLSKLALADQADHNDILDLGVGEVWYTFTHEGLKRHYRETNVPPYRFRTGFERLDPSQLQDRFWACCHAAQRELWKERQGERPYSTPMKVLDALQDLLGDKPLRSLAMSAETIRKFYALPFYEDWDHRGTIRPPKTWRPFHERLEKLHVHVLDSNGPLGEVYGFTHQELVGRIPYFWLRGECGVAVMVGGVAKVTVTEDGKPIDLSKLLGDDDE